MNIREYNESIHLSEWTKMVGECRNSGKTVKAWCSENGISAKTYYYRQKKVCSAMRNMRGSAALPAKRSDSEVGFVEMAPGLRQMAGGTAIRIWLGNAEVHVHNGAEAETVEAALRALSRIC